MQCNNIKLHFSIKAYNINNLKIKYISIFISLFILIFFIITLASDERLKKLTELEEDLIDTTYESIVSEYTTHADILFENVINKDDVLKIFSEANQTPDKSRKELYEKLQPMYKNMKNFKLRQLHFHLKNNDSFLRFHRPKKYGDDLSNFRATVKYVNEKHLFTSGFEEGRIYNGYRFVYPLSFGDKHIGSVETSISMQSIIDSLTKLLRAKVNFILDKSIVEDKVFKEELSNYKIYKALPNHVVDKNIKQSQIMDKILNKNNSNLALHLHSDKELPTTSFYETVDSKGYIVSVVSLKRALSNKSVAHIIILREHPELYYIKIQKTVVMFLLILLVGLVLHFMYKSEMKNIKLTLSEKKFKKLFNLHKNIIVVTDGKNIKMANDAMEEFFSIDDLNFFTKYHKDISDRFIESKDHFSIRRVPQDQSWIEAIEPLLGDHKIVVMYDQYNKKHAFNVSVSRYNDNDYIVLFTDISTTITEKMNLSNKVIRDTLTGAYNREFFNLNISTIIKLFNSDKYLGLTMLDIDFFKKANDDFGHAVGDSVLKELTSLVNSIIREDDYFIRWGGEEFIILTKTSSIEILDKAIEHVRSTIENTSFSGVTQITCSFGSTLYIDGEDITETIIRADEALYKAKDNGRNQVITI